MTKGKFQVGDTVKLSPDYFDRTGERCDENARFVVIFVGRDTLKARCITPGKPGESRFVLGSPIIVFSSDFAPLSIKDKFRRREFTCPGLG